jgi:hypothetical protein
LGIFRGTRVAVPLNFGNDSVEVSRAQATGAVRWVEGWEEREEWVWAFEGGFVWCVFVVVLIVILGAQ